MYKYGALEETENKDPKTGGVIRVSTTARIRFREMYPDYSTLRNVRLNAIISDLFSKSSSNVLHYFKLGKSKGDDPADTPKELGEIRGGGSGFFFISAIRGGYVDILTVQSGWKEPPSGKRKTEPPKGPSGGDFSLANLDYDMKKKANIQAVWPQIYTMLKSPPQGINLGNFPSKLPPMNKIMIEGSPLSDNPQAVGYVTTEDTDDDGTLDTIHISSERFMQELERHGLARGEISKLNQLPPERLASLLSAFVDVLSHEMGHLDDYRHGEENPFPGGEGVADRASHNALQQISVATNKRNFNRNRRHKMSALKILAELANDLDMLKETKAADIVTDMMKNKIKKKADLEEYSRSTPPRDPLEPIRTTPPEGFGEPGSLAYRDAPPASMGKVQKPTIVGTPGPIKPKGDPFTYKYVPQRDAFMVSSYDPSVRKVPGGERAVGAYLTRANKAAWSVLEKYLPKIGPSEDLPLRGHKDPQRNLATWINQGYFGEGFRQDMQASPAGGGFEGTYMQALSSGELDNEGINELGRLVTDKVMKGRVKNVDRLLELLKEVSNSLLGHQREQVGEDIMLAPQNTPLADAGGTPYSEADDFSLAYDQSVEDIKKQAAANVEKLSVLFSYDRIKGPFGRD